MSTKIYNGLKIEANSLDEAIDIISKGKPEIVQSYTDMAIKKEFYISVSVMVDYLINQNEILKEHFNIDSPDKKYEVDEQSSAMSVAYMKVLDNTQESKTSMVIYPSKFEISNKNYYLMTIYADNIMQKKMLETYIDKISEYAYWNNNDPPENLTEQDWEIRQQHWEKVLLSKSSNPSIEGLSINFIANNQPTAYLSLAERLENLEKMCSENKSYKSYSLEHKIIDMMIQILSDNPNFNKGNTYELITKVKNKDFNPKELAQYEKLEKIVNEKIPEELTPEIMKTKLIDLKKILKIKAMNDKLNNELTQKNKIKPPKL